MQFVGSFFLWYFFFLEKKKQKNLNELFRLRSNLSLGLTKSSLMRLKKEEIALAERSRSQKR
jgi:hypothetical protein